MSEVLDYIRQVNQLSGDLLRSHGELLGRKNIRRKQELIQVIKLDLDKLAHALLEVQENRAESVLRNFFGESALSLTALGDRLADRHIYHVGFEIHEPLDLVLYGIRHWIERSKRALGAEMRIKEFLRFPASAAFQGRVGAYTEIMRIWLQVDERALMLELFDIYRPADAALAAEPPKLTHRNFHGLVRGDHAASGHRQRLAGLFGPDEIWHYALHVKQPADVVQLHAEMQELAKRDSGYVLAYAAPVHNLHDGSFHTKIIRPAKLGEVRLELEFVTHHKSPRSQPANHL